MTTETALATREYSDQQIRTRIELNRSAGYGLERASQAQLNTVFFLCQRYDADPLTDITLFEGRPFWTIDGRLRFMRRHPDFRGYDCRPLTKAEKPDWGYEPDDIVIECTIRTANWGNIKARGKVTHAEVMGARERAEREHKRPAPIGVHPVEIAEKRAIARAERAAFGQDAVPDDDEIAEAVTTVIEQRNDPAKLQRDAAEYQRIYGDFYPDEGTTSTASPAVVEDEAPVEPSPSAGAVVASKSHPLWKRWLELERKAREAAVDDGTDSIKLGEVTEESLTASCADLESRIAEALGAKA